MAQRCTICRHKSRGQIDTELALRNLTREAVAARFGVSRSAICRHLAGKHSEIKLARIADNAVVQASATLFEKFQRLELRAFALLDRAEKSGHVRETCAALHEVRETIKIMATLTGELQNKPVINVGIQLNVQEEVKKCLELLRV